MTTLRHAHLSPWPFPSLSSTVRRDLRRAREGGFQGTRGVFPPVNLRETEDSYVLSAELPGVAPGDIDVSIEGKTVTLAGERKVEYAAGNGVSVHRRERQSGLFRRAFELPDEIEVEEARARHKYGVLTLELPKTKARKPRQVEIETE